MKRIALLIFLVVYISLISFAKKDINAWKNEKNLEQQYIVFKKNLNYWKDFYSLKLPQLEQFHDAIMDSVALLERIVAENNSQILLLNNELETKQTKIDKTQLVLDESIKKQNSITTLGIEIHKNIYTLIFSTIIIGLMVLLVFVFLMFRRSNNITSKTKKEYKGLKEEFEVHRKNSLERYTKKNTELHKARMALNKK